MPTKVITKRPAQRVRQAAYRRKVLAIARRKGKPGEGKKAPSVIANSVFALTLKHKPGFEVSSLVKGDRSALRDGDDYFLMYAQLFPVMQRAVLLATGEHTSFDPLLQGGLSIGESLGYVISIMKRNVVPKNFDLRVDHDDDLGYYFTIHQYAPFRDFWHVFEIRPAVQYLRTHNERLHELFCDFIGHFYLRTGILTWWNGGLGYAEHMMEEKIEMWEDQWGETIEDSEECALAFDSACLTVMEYSAGEVAAYQDRIQKQQLSYPALVTAILQTKASGPIIDDIVNWMRAAIDFIKKPGCVDDYMYHSYLQENEIEGVMFDQQSVILWDWEDEYSKLESECLDSTVQGVGVHPPQLHYHFTMYTQKFDRNEMADWLAWPGRLSQLWERYEGFIGKIKKQEKKDRRGKK